MTIHVWTWHAGAESTNKNVVCKLGCECQNARAAATTTCPEFWRQNVYQCPRCCFVCECLCLSFSLSSHPDTITSNVLTHSHTQILSHTRTHTQHTHTHTHTPSLTHTHSLSLTQPHSHTHTHRRHLNRHNYTHTRAFTHASANLAYLRIHRPILNSKKANIASPENVEHKRMRFPK